MTSDAVRLGTMALTGAAFVYEASQGNIMEAALVPVGGFVVHKVGECFKSNTVDTVGSLVLLTSVALAPGVGVGLALHAACGRTLAATAIAAVVGGVVSYFTCSRVIDYGAACVARALH